MRGRRQVLTVASWMGLVFSCTTHACVIVPNTFEVGNEFRVSVADRGHPVIGLRLTLSTNGSPDSPSKVVMESITDSEGYAYFSNLSPGSLWLSPDHDGSGGYAVIINVSPSNPAGTSVFLSWPNRAPIGVRSASGVLRTTDYYPNQVQAPMSLSLLEGISGREVETTKTDSKGRFTFASNVAAGIYFLRLNPSGSSVSQSEEDWGTIPIEVSPAAGLDALDLDVGWTDCGLVYAERVKQSPLRVGRICGDVADSEGGVISSARVWLLADGEDPKILDQTQTSATGEFLLRDQPEGNYQLLVKSRGFRAYLTVIYFELRPSPSGCQNRIHVHLGVL